MLIALWKMKSQAWHDWTMWAIKPEVTRYELIIFVAVVLLSNVSINQNIKYWSSFTSYSITQM